MSTTHTPAPLHLWWYVAAAVLAGVLLALLIAGLRSPAPLPTSRPSSGQHPARLHQGYRPVSHACFAMRPVGNRDLARTGCAVTLP